MKAGLRYALAVATAMLAALAWAEPKHATITAHQRGRIALAAAAPPSANAKLAALIDDGRPALIEFLSGVSCRSDYDPAAFLRPASERTPNNDPGPMTELSSSHRDTVCLTVERIRGWRLVGDDSIAFDVRYVSDDTAESLDKRYLATRGPNGAWSFRYFREK